MLRRAALLACLLAPLAARAQTAGVVNPYPNAVIGTAECSSSASADAMTLGWQIAFVSGFTTIPTGAFYRILASNTSGCATTSGTTVTGTIADNIAATSVTQTYPTGGTLLPADLVAAAGKTCTTGTDSTIYVCVQLLQSGGGTVVGNASASLTLQLTSPGAPTIGSVSPGDGALTIAWSASGTGAAATSYRVVVTARDTGLDGTVHTGTTSNTSLRISGLQNDVLYDAVVYAISDGGNESGPSAAAQGTPQAVLDFYSQYRADGGVEQGGCAGGPAGAASLLGLAALLRAFRRRP